MPKGKMSGYFQLMRPANLVTAVADVLAGVTIAGALTMPDAGLSIALLCISTIGLYGGGVVFNDVFDAELDKKERPERPIPSGRVPVERAILLGLLLLAVGIGAAFAVHGLAGMLAVLISVAALVYDKWGKHHPIAGPVNMGICRGLNLLLGISILPAVFYEQAYLGIIPVIYIAAVTTISRGEVHGSDRRPLYLSAGMYVSVLFFILAFAASRGQMIPATVLTVLLAWMIGKPLLRAIGRPEGPLIGKAVKAGVVALIVLNATWAAAAGSLPMAIIILTLLPLSLILAKTFAVT